jgi:protein-S-isoprenylcysteine O-methyltransferase Ste14
MWMGVRRQAFFAVPLVVGSLIAAFGLLGYLLENALGIPNRLGLPWAIRGLGIAVLGLGFTFLVWIFRCRKPDEVLVSTYVSMRKAVRRTPPAERSSRTEPLILEGPQRYVRNPMYFADVTLFLGWWLTLDYTFLLFLALFFFLWFNLVVIPFEERELKALYGEEYTRYARAVPRFFPSLKSRWP